MKNKKILMDKLRVYDNFLKRHIKKRLKLKKECSKEYHQSVNNLPRVNHSDGLKDYVNSSVQFRLLQMSQEKLYSLFPEIKN